MSRLVVVSRRVVSYEVTPAGTIDALQGSTWGPAPMTQCVEGLVSFAGQPQEEPSRRSRGGERRHRWSAQGPKPVPSR